jgi:Helicase HerA, central domain
VVEGAAPAAEALQQRLTASQESAFHVSLYLTVTAPTSEALRVAAAEVEAAARSALCELAPCTFRQLDGRLATLPLGRDVLRRRRVLDTSALATLFPWFDADLQDEGGLVVGASRATGQPVVVDPFDATKLANANIGIFGHSGAGKTYLLSTIAMGALGLGAQVFVIDPEHEYGALARRLGGLDVELALGSGHAINVLDLPGGARDESTLGPAVADAATCVASSAATSTRRSARRWRPRFAPRSRRSSCRRSRSAERQRPAACSEAVRGRDGHLHVRRCRADAGPPDPERSMARRDHGTMTSRGDPAGVMIGEDLRESLPFDLVDDVEVVDDGADRRSGCLRHGPAHRTPARNAHAGDRVTRRERYEKGDHDDHGDALELPDEVVEGRGSGCPHRRRLDRLHSEWQNDTHSSSMPPCASLRKPQRLLLIPL